MADLMDVTYVKDLYDGTWTPELQTRAEKWLTTALARAKTTAPCLVNHEGLPEHVQESARGIIAGAVLRLMSPTKGATQYQAAGPFSVNTDTKLRSDRILTIADRDELKQLCRAAAGRRRRGGTIRTPLGW